MIKNQPIAILNADKSANLTLIKTEDDIIMLILN
jgi:hypothetical protein